MNTELDRDELWLLVDLLEERIGELDGDTGEGLEACGRLLRKLETAATGSY
tara:strand:+ start:97 stop:249 length:153 start_codon:yes stop_codon:yes gene_type:complete